MSRARIFITGVFLSIALGLRLADASTALIGYLFLGIYALTGRQQVIEALALSWLFSMLNPGIAVDSTAGSVGRYAVIFAAGASALLHSRIRVNTFRVGRMILMTALLGLFFVVHAFFFSPIIGVSVLKAVSWTLVMTTVFSVWSALDGWERTALADRVFRGLIAVTLVSLPLIALPVGYLRNGTGFQGVLNHPQVFGPMVALLGVWAISRMLRESRPPWSYVGLGGTCLVLVVLSEARTAGVALVLGIVVAIATVSRLSGRPASTILPGLKSRRLAFLGMLMVLSAIISGPQLEYLLDRFIAKSGRAEVSSLLEAYERSRGGLMDDMWTNIESKPLQGIGFGIASDPSEMDIVRDPMIGLPISASVEKGVLPLAVWEEVGLVGFLLVAAWVVKLLRYSARGGIVQFSVAITVLLLNMGESTLFSPGGFGLLSLLLLAWAFSSGCSNARRGLHE